MNKSEFIDRLAQKGYTKKSANEIVDDVIQTISEVLVEGESIQFYGFGTFSVRESAEREAVDFQTKERITIPGHKTPKFVPGKLLKRAVKEGILRE